jgi:hypothetical protein
VGHFKLNLRLSLKNFVKFLAESVVILTIYCCFCYVLCPEERFSYDNR